MNQLFIFNRFSVAHKLSVAKRISVIALAAHGLFAQDGLTPGALRQRPLPTAPAVEFTSTSNASQAGASLVLGYQFTVRTAVILNSLGAILQGSSPLSSSLSSARPIFGALPASMAVALWDEDQNLLVSATVSASDPATGSKGSGGRSVRYRSLTVAARNEPARGFHTYRRPVPGVGYTIAGLAPAGWSALSDAPGITPGSAIVFGGARSFASGTPAFPDRNVVCGAVVKPDGSASLVVIAASPPTPSGTAATEVKR